MAEYPIFSQLQGPVIPVQLYPEAMQAGASVGSTLIQTAIAAAKAPGQIEGQNVQNELAQAEIDNIPIENQIRQQQLQNQTLQTQINAAKLQSETANQKQDLEQQASVLTGQNVLATALGSQDKDTVKAAFQDPHVMAAFMDDPDTKYHALSMAAGMQDADGNYVFDDNERQAFAEQMDFLQTQKNQEAQDKIDRAVKQKAANAFMGDFNKAQQDGVISTFGVETPSDLKAIQMYPKDTKVTDANGKIIGSRPLSDEFAASPSAQRTYDVFKNGVKQEYTANNDDFKAWKKLQSSYTAYMSLNGAGANTQSAQIKATVNGGQPGAAQVQASPLAASLTNRPMPAEAANIPTNQTIVNQANKELESLKMSPPPGMMGQDLDTRLKIQNDAIRQKFAPAGVKVEPTPAAKAAPFIPGPTPPAANDQLSKVTGTPVALNTEVVRTPAPETWQKINSNPNLQGESALIKGMADVESLGNPDAKSPTGVQGLLGVTKATAAHYGLNRDNPKDQITAGKKLLHDNLVIFNGNLRLALTAYSAAGMSVLDAVHRTGTTDWPTIKNYLKQHLSDDAYNQAKDYADRVISSAAHFVDPNSPQDKLLVSELQAEGLLKHV